jgi:phospholipid/cholesterol/gamma-HCH transport system substrate-binding protein
VRKFSEMNQARVGVIGFVTLMLLWMAVLNVGALKSVFGARYSAAFAEAGGLREGNDVKISGYTVGHVTSMKLEDLHVRVDFVVEDARIGDETTAAIKTESALGTKYLALEPRGAGELESGSEIPLARTRAPYDVTEVLSDLTTTTERLDVEQMAHSFDTMAATFQSTPGEMRSTLRGVSRLSQVIASRDEALRRVLANARGVSGVLAQRNAQIATLVTDGNALMTMIEARRDAIRRLLVGVQTVTRQMSLLAQDNAHSLRPAVHELRRTLAMLKGNAHALDRTAQLYAGYARALSEALASGPYFYGYTQNTQPTKLAPLLPRIFSGEDDVAGAGR